MPLKRFLGFLSIFIFLLFFPTKTFAFQCITFSQLYYLACEDGFCQGFEKSFPACVFVPELRDLDAYEKNALKSYIVESKNIDTPEGLWKIRVSPSCWEWFHNRLGMPKTAFKESCGEDHLSEVEIIILDVDNVSEAYADIKAEAEQGVSRAIKRRNKNIFFQFLFFIGAGSGIFLALIIRYILHGGQKRIALISFWIFVQSSFYFYLGQFGYRFWYSEGVEWMLLVLPVFFLIGIGMLIGNWINNRTLYFKNINRKN